jgi:hypothetical protein
MWEYINSWVIGPIGALLMGVLGNLLTTPAVRLLSFISARRREKPLKSELSAYSFLLSADKNNKLIYVVLLNLYQALFYFIIVSILVVFSIAKTIYTIIDMLIPSINEQTTEKLLSSGTIHTAFLF